MRKAIIQLEQLACPACLLKIEAAVKSVDGVNKDDVNVLFNSSKAKLTFDENKTSIEEIEAAIKKIGYIVEKSVVK